MEATKHKPWHYKINKITPQRKQMYNWTGMDNIMQPLPHCMFGGMCPPHQQQDVPNDWERTCCLQRCCQCYTVSLWKKCVAKSCLTLGSNSIICSEHTELAQLVLRVLGGKEQLDELLLRLLRVRGLRLLAELVHGLLCWSACLSSKPYSNRCGRK